MSRVHVIRTGPPSNEPACLADDVFECSEVAPFDTDACPEPLVVHSETAPDGQGGWACIHCGERTAHDCEGEA